ncbi:MAG: gluconate 2-dehydrogenase subunit 3 family protein [Sphingobacteriia bacterium]|nr:gluconate 2-dehydrogenase subunit 3 family protein [Sphingobacteriia bacterium]
MDRRKSIKALVLGTVSTGLLVEACKTNEVKQPDAKADAFTGADRMLEEKAAYEKLMKEENFFTSHEMDTIKVLQDIIIPKDAVSGSATDAKVHEFIAYIIKEKTELQTPLRGGLKWLDMQSLQQFDKVFTEAGQQQQIELIDAIAWPKKAKKEMAQGVAFFSLMRNLVATGFYTSEIGVKDVGYMGNQPNQWNGVPDEVLKQYGLSYSEKELRECAKYS